MDPLVWAVLLLLLGLSLAVLEIFVPSGGILGFLSVTSILGAIVLSFRLGGMVIGLIFIVVTAVALPTALGLGFRYWPHTPMGRRILLQIPDGQEALPDNEARRALRELIGKTGHAKSMMLPSGSVIIDGRTVDAVTEGDAVEPGQLVRVIEVHGTRVVVRPADEASPPPRKADDVLSQPIETLGIESNPLDDPLA